MFRNKKERRKKATPLADVALASVSYFPMFSYKQMGNFLSKGVTETNARAHKENLILLTLSQTTQFRHFQTERASRRQCQV